MQVSFNLLVGTSEIVMMLIKYLDTFSYYLLSFFVYFISRSQRLSYIDNVCGNSFGYFWQL